MKTIILVSLCLCLMVSVISADKAHKHQGKLVKSGHEEHKKHTEVQTLKKDEAELKIHNPTNEQPAVAKPAGGSGRKHRNNHHGKNKKGANAESQHSSRSRKSQTKPNKHNGQQQKSHNNKHHGRKHGRGKQTQ
ncbi:uncharacterized protein ACRADG_010496 [Cochliomyia hominivorax]